MSRSRTVTNTSADALFKEFYGKGNDQSLINKKTPFTSLLMKNKKADFVGDQFVQPVRFGSAVGLGYRAVGRNLPSPGAAPRGKAVFPAVRAYGTAEFDREAIKSSRNDKGAFAKVTVDEVDAVEEGFQIHMLERALLGDGSGKLGEVLSLTGSGTEASPWILVMATTGTNAPKHKKRFYPEGARIDVFAADVLQCTVEVVSSSSTSVTCFLISTASDNTPAIADILYWEGNKDGECVGIGKLAPNAAGTLYGISQTTRPQFSGLVTSITGALAYDDINDHIADLEEEIGSPDIGICSYAAASLLKNQAEESKRYSVSEIKVGNTKIGFKGIEVMTADGPIPLIASPMQQDDEIAFVNTKFLQIVMREDFGWFDDDGTILLRDNDKDVYNARYGGYFELFCSKPNSVGRLKGFTV